MSHPTLEQGTVKLCGTQGCCPAVNFDDPNEVVLTDDFGGRVRLSRDEWQDLKSRFATNQKQD